jgi:hypothetical protein
VTDREAIYEYACIEGEPATCWLRQFDALNRECSGRMDRAHLIEKQRLRKEGHADLIDDPRTWVPACRLHHFSWDAYRGVTVPREALPEPLVALCDELGLLWWIDRRYPERSAA